jgi:hypothetical protein
MHKSDDLSKQTLLSPYELIYVSISVKQRAERDCSVQSSEGVCSRQGIVRHVVN